MGDRFGKTFCPINKVSVVLLMKFLCHLYMYKHATSRTQRQRGRMQKARRFPPYPVEVVDDVSWIASSEVGHRNVDLLVVFFQVDADILLQLLSP